MAANYWTRTLRQRVGRRRALTLAGGSAAAAAFLAACGSDDDDTPAATGGGSTGGGSTGGGSTGGGSTGGGSTGGGSTGGGSTSGLITQPTYTEPAQAKRGGVFKDFAQGAVESIDPYSGQRGLNDVADKVFSSLFTEEPGKFEESAHVLKGDLAESWEVSPDGLQATLNLRQGVKWHNIDPVNGRTFDSSDVMASMDRYKEIGNLGALIFNERGPAGFIESYSAPDDSTVIVNFTEPLAWALSWFAPFGGYTSTFMIVSREAANGEFNADQQMIGTGPFYLGEYDPGIKFVLERNTDYWDPDWALVDTIEMPIVPEYAALQAQLKAGNIFWGRDPRIVRPTDTLQVLDDQPDLLLYQGERVVGTSVLTYGVEPFLDGVNPLEDERVRQALSLAYDRDLDIDVQYNVEQFADAGLDVQVWWNSHLSQRPDFSGGGWVLDPRESDFGENAKYFQYNIEEAKALLSAAGYPDGFEIPFRYPHAAAFSRSTRVEPLFFYLQEIGLSVVQNPQTDYIGDYIPNNRDAGGQYPGIGFHSITAGIPSSVDPTASLYAEHHPDNTVTFHGYNGGQGDPAIVELLTKAKSETDVEVRKDLNHQVQRLLGKSQWCMIESGAASGFHVVWPAVANARVYNSAPSTWDHYQLWIDDTKKPLA